MEVFERFFSPDVVSGAQTTTCRLFPFVHTAPSRFAQAIWKQKKLEKMYCNKFDEELLYFFYARPAYRKVEEAATTDRSLLPVVFVVNPTDINIKRVYPFDTGAYNMYVPTYLSKDSKISDYEMPNNLNAIQQYTLAMCTTNFRYFSGTYNNGSELPESIVLLRNTNHDLDNLLKLLSNEAVSEVDDRSMTVEVQIAGDVDISDKLVAIIAPHFYKNDPEFLRMVSETGAEPRYYSSRPKHRLLEYVGIVFERAEQYYIDFNYMERDA